MSAWPPADKIRPLHWREFLSVQESKALHEHAQGEQPLAPFVLTAQHLSRSGRHVSQAADRSQQIRWTVGHGVGLCQPRLLPPEARGVFSLLTSESLLAPSSWDGMIFKNVAKGSSLNYFLSRLAATTFSEFSQKVTKLL